jgi:hypothetical protein
MLEIKDSSICFQVILYTPMPIAAAIPAETRSVSWLAPERVLTPKETTEKDSIIIRETIGMSESQIDGIGVSLQGEALFIFAVVFFCMKIEIKTS